MPPVSRAFFCLERSVRRNREELSRGISLSCLFRMVGPKPYALTPAAFSRHANNLPLNALMPSASKFVSISNAIFRTITLYFAFIGGLVMMSLLRLTSGAGKIYAAAYVLLYACVASVGLAWGHRVVSRPTASYSCCCWFWAIATVHYVAIAVFAVTRDITHQSKPAQNGALLMQVAAVLLAALAVVRLAFVLTSRKPAASAFRPSDDRIG